jgi:hypothetical protein
LIEIEKVLEIALDLLLEDFVVLERVDEKVIEAIFQFQQRLTIDNNEHGEGWTLAWMKVIGVCRAGASHPAPAAAVSI